MIFFTKNPNLKDNFFFFFFDVGEGGGGRLWVRGGYSKRISLNKNPNVNKKMWGGGECGGGGG